MIDKESRLVTMHIIFVKGTVKTLLPFFYSLLDHSDCNYKLVSNGCHVTEEDLLSQLAHNEERVRFVSLQNDQILLHHEVLHKLLAHENSPYFAFMDSDIIASGDFLDVMMKQLDYSDCVYTGLPVWHEASDYSMPENFQLVGGRFVQDYKGYPLGLSYFAIYKTKLLKAFIDSSGIDMRRYEWKDVPEQYKPKLVELGLNKNFYDTAKLLNILWQQSGGKLSYCDVPTILHLGGISGELDQMKNTSSIKESIKKMIPLKLKILLKFLFLKKGIVTINESLDMERLIRKREISKVLLGQVVHHKVLSIDRKLTDEFPLEFHQKLEYSMKKVSSTIDQYVEIGTN